MNAEPFHADEVHPPLVTKADDGAPLPGGIGWVCAECGGLYVKKEAAELCCMKPDAVVSPRAE